MSTSSVDTQTLLDAIRANTTNLEQATGVSGVDANAKKVAPFTPVKVKATGKEIMFSKLFFKPKDIPDFPVVVNKPDDWAPEIRAAFRPAILPITFPCY